MKTFPPGFFHLAHCSWDSSVYSFSLLSRIAVNGGTTVLSIYQLKDICSQSLVVMNKAAIHIHIFIFFRKIYRKWNNFIRNQSCMSNLHFIQSTFTHLIPIITIVTLRTRLGILPHFIDAGYETSLQSRLLSSSSAVLPLKHFLNILSVQNTLLDAFGVVIETT